MLGIHLEECRSLTLAKVLSVSSDPTGPTVAWLLEVIIGYDRGMVRHDLAGSNYPGFSGNMADARALDGVQLTPCCCCSSSMASRMGMIQFSNS